MPNVCHDRFPSCWSNPRSFAASMAGLRQGLALLHLKGRNVVEDGADRRFLASARNGRSPGEETWGEPLQQGSKRRSRPLPTKAIDEAVGERGSEPSSDKEIWQGWVRVQCLADWLCAKLVCWACRTKAHPLPMLRWTTMPGCTGFLCPC
jgi:hypothetical protein